MESKEDSVRRVVYNQLIAKKTYECMEFWRDLRANGYTWKQANELRWRLDRIALLRLEREYPPYKGPNY